MARVAVKGGGAYNSRRYLRRPVESGPEFQNLTRLIAQHLPSGILFIPEPRHSAHVSLLHPSTLRAAIAKSKRRHKLLPHELLPRLRQAVPLSGDDRLSAPIAEIRRLGDGSTLAMILNCPKADEEREQIHLHLERLGHVGLRRSGVSCHITLGTFSESVPSSIIERAQENAPAALMLGAVLPRLDELAAGAHFLNAA